MIGHRRCLPILYGLAYGRRSQRSWPARGRSAAVRLLVVAVPQALAGCLQAPADPVPPVVPPVVQPTPSRIAWALRGVDPFSSIVIGDTVFGIAVDGAAVAAHSASTGAVLWTVALNPRAPSEGAAQLVAAGRYLVLARDGLWAIDRASRRQQWTRPDLATSEIDATDANGGTVMVGGLSSGPASLSLADGTLRWSRPELVSNGTTARTPVLVGDSAVVFGVRRAGDLRFSGYLEVRFRDGALVRQVSITPDLPSPANWATIGPPLPAQDSLVVIAVSSGVLYGIDRRTGVIRWRAPRDARQQPPLEDTRFLAAHSGRLYASSISGWVTCYDLVDGRVLWEFDVGRTFSLLDTPIVDGGRLYIGALDGSLTSLDISGGTPRLEWRERTDTIRTSIAVGVTATRVIGSNFRGSLPAGLAGIRR